VCVSTDIIQHSQTLESKASFIAENRSGNGKTCFFENAMLNFTAIKLKHSTEYQCSQKLNAINVRKISNKLLTSILD